MKLLCYEFQELDPTVLGLLKGSVDELVTVLCGRMDEIFAHAGASVVAGRPHNNRACKYVLNLMANVFNVPSLACSVSVGAVGDCGLASSLWGHMCSVRSHIVYGAICSVRSHQPPRHVAQMLAQSFVLSQFSRSL